MEEIIKKYNEILKEAKKFKLQKEKTLFEITKYPYREKVSSNILAFYLNINEEHKLQDLFIRALIITANQVIKNNTGRTKKLIDNDIEINELEVETEYCTENDKLIDILVYNKNFAIGIENKLEANLYNDLEEYAKTIDKKNKVNYKIVLSIKPEQTQAGFINILYKDLFNNLKEPLKNVKDKQNKWYIFLIEFIETILRKEESDFMDKEFSKWYVEKTEDIRTLIKGLIQAQNKACDKVNELGEKLDVAIAPYGYTTSRYNTDRNRIGRELCYSICNIADIKLDDNIKITIDNVYSPKGWELKFYTGKKNREPAIHILKKYNIDSHICDNTHIKLYDFQDNDPEYKEIIEKNKEIIKIFGDRKY